MHYENLRKINYIQQQFSKTSRLYGFKKIYPKAIASYPEALEYYGASNPKLISFTNTKGGVNILHEDPTISLFDANITKEKLYYLTTAYTWETSLETLKGGVENFSKPSLHSDSEMIMMAYDFLKSINIKAFKIEVGHTGFIDGLLSTEAINAVDKKNLISAIHNKNIPMIKKITDDLSLDDDTVKGLITIPKLFGGYNETLNKARAINLESLKNVIEYLEDLKNLLAQYPINMKQINIDLSLTNKYSYYDGLIFKAYHHNFGKKILQGGRYKNNNNQGIGFGFKVEDLLGVIRMRKNLSNTVDYTVLIDDLFKENTLKVINDLREKGMRVETKEEDLTPELIKNCDSRFILKIIDDQVRMIDNLENRTRKTNIQEFIKSYKSIALESIH